MRWRLALGGVLALPVVYNVRPAGLPVYTTAIIAGFGVAVAAVTIALRGGRFRFDPVWSLSLGLLVAYLAWVLYRGAVSDPLDLFLLKSTTALVLTLVPAAAVVDKVASPSPEGIPRAVLYLYLAFVLQGVFVVLAFVSPSFRATLISIIPPTGNLDPMHPLRMRGFSHSGGSFVAVSQAIGLLVGGHLLVTSGARTALRAGLVVAGLLIIVTSILLTGRTGFLVLPLVAVHIAWSALGRWRHPVRTAPVVGVILAVFVLGVTARTVAPETGRALGPVVDRVMAEFETGGAGEIRSRTLDVLFGRMWFAPESPWQMAVGDGSTWHERRIRSDLGVIRRLHATGLVGVLLAFAAITALAWPALARSSAPADRRLTFLILLWAMLLEFKEPLALTSGVAAPLLILSVAASRAAMWNHASE